MTYNILLIRNNGDKGIENARRLLEEVGRRFSRSFAFDACDLKPHKTETFCWDPGIIKKAKSAHAVLLGGELLNLRGICRELGLYASVRRAGDCFVINDAFGGIYDGEKGFGSNAEFGREAYDVESYSELEIERVARIAYELSPTRHITLIDKADRLNVSKLWRKIVTDINEDYPYVTVDMTSVEDAIQELLQTRAPDTLLTSHLFGDIIYSVLSAKYANTISPSEVSKHSKSNKVAKFAAFLGDTALGMYALASSPLKAPRQNKLNETPISLFEAPNRSNCNEAAEAVAFMLRHSLDMHEEADYLEKL